MFYNNFQERGEFIMKKYDLLSCLTLIFSMMFLSPFLFADEAPQSASIHAQQEQELLLEPQMISEDALEAEALAKSGALFPSLAKKPEVKAAAPSIGNDFIVFGYLQNDDVVFHLRWQALTHIASLFVSFDQDGHLTNKTGVAWDNRDPYLKAGGAAQAAGVKMIMCVANFDDDPSGDIEQVMTTPAKRTTLVNEIVAAVTGDGYCQGITIDLEFTWGATIRDGITAFFSQLRSTLPSQYEISVYTHAIYSTTKWDIPNLEPSLDYLLYSSYDWASGNTAHAITDFNNCLPYLTSYMNAGLPPEKLVLVVSSYSRRWEGITAYNTTGSGPASQGFTDGLYDTTLNTTNSGPHTNNYVTGDEVGWYTWNAGGTNYTATWDNPASLEYKIRHALSFQGATWNGRRLRGVGFWSLYWFAELSSYDPRASLDVARTRTYPHIYQLCEEILSTPGDTQYLIDGFEGLDYRWRDPNEAKDTSGDTDVNSYRTIVTSPAGSGAPADTTNAISVIFDFENSSGNKCVLAHEVLNSRIARSVPDINAVAGVVDSTTKLSAYIYTASAYSGRYIRMMLIDNDRDLEVSDQYSLATTGWRKIEWDLTDSGQINAFTTSEPNFLNGDGVLDTSGGGAKDIKFFGFLIEGGGAGSGQVTIDELGYEHANPGAKNYAINEFRYQNPAIEFVEIYGPAGAFPSNTQLRFFNPTNGTVLKTFALSGTIPNDTGTGYGYWVIGDSTVPNVDSSTGFGGAVDDLPDTDPSAVQIYNTGTGCVYDSVVYEAYGGLDSLIRMETLGVTGEGYPWLGRIADGGNSSSVDYTQGRYPNGNDTNVNNNDFSFMPATPGASNGDSLSLPVNFNFTSVPSTPFQTFQDFTTANPASAGLPASGNGGNAYRCVDTTGGGNMAVFGDKGLGDGGGYQATGEIYIPPSTDPVQAIAIGIAGNHGSTFFSSSRDGNSYEDGYWIIYENAAGVGMDDGRSDHSGVFEFVMASHDNMDGNPVALIASKTLANLSITAGTWVSFDMTIDPDNATPANRLIIKLNSATVYQGDIPAGGRTSGAFVVGYRENHTGAPVAKEGTWIDNLTIGYVGGATPTPTPTTTPTPTSTPTSTSTPTPTPTLTPTPTPTPSSGQTLIEDFELYVEGEEVMFRDPEYSGSTSGIDGATDSSAASDDETNTLLDPAVGSLGSLSHRFFWEWSATSGGIVRATTHNAVNRPNPIVDFTKGLSLYVKITSGAIKLTVQFRDNGAVGAIGENGGAAGEIERITQRFTLDSSVYSGWQYIFYNLPTETYEAMTGNGTLNNSSGTLEALWIEQVDGNQTDVELFVDDIYQGTKHNVNISKISDWGLYE